MDTSQFDRLSKIFAASGSRRTLALLLAALPLSGISRLDQEADAANPRRRRRQRSRSRDRVTQEKKKKKLLCFNRETILAKKKKKKKLLKQGATLGECPPLPPTPPPPSPPAPPPPPPPPPSCDWSFSAQIGAGVQGSGTDQFNFHHGVDVSPDSLTAWVADTGNNRVMVWTRPDGSSTTWSFNAQIGTGTAGSDTDQFSNPYGVAVSPDGLTAWVADSSNSRVAVWTRPNASSTSWSFNAQIGTDTFGSGTDQFWLPRGVAVSPDGLTAWVADTFNHRVMVWTRPDTSSTVWSFKAQIGSGTLGSSANQFHFPEGVAVSPDGLTVWVADFENSRVMVWTRPNASSTVWSSTAQIGAGDLGSGNDQFRLPVDVAVSADGLSVWVADGNNHRVMVWTRPNASSTTWSFNAQIGTGTRGSGTNQFDRTRGVAVSADGLTVWVADGNNERVMVWTIEGCPS